MQHIFTILLCNYTGDVGNMIHCAVQHYMCTALGNVLAVDWKTALAHDVPYTYSAGNVIICCAETPLHNFTCMLLFIMAAKFHILPTDNSPLRNSAVMPFHVIHTVMCCRPDVSRSVTATASTVQGEEEERAGRSRVRADVLPVQSVVAGPASTSVHASQVHTLPVLHSCNQVQACF